MTILGGYKFLHTLLGTPLRPCSLPRPSAPQKRLNRSRCRLGCELGRVQGSMNEMEVHIGATWRIRLNRRSM